MIVSADLSEELVQKIEGLIRPEPDAPAWPFVSRTVVPAALSPADYKAYLVYQEALAVYEKRLREGLRNRSAVVKMILTTYFEKKNGNR